MGLYVNPPEIAEQQGRPIELKGTLEETRTQLNEGEEVCAVAKRGFGEVALVVATEWDHECVRRELDALKGVFAIPKSLVPS